MRIILLITLVLSSLLTSGQSKSSFGGDMALIMQDMKSYTLMLASQMPESEYDYRPTKESRSFREQVEHIATSLDFQLTYILSGKKINQDDFLTEYRKINEEISGIAKAVLLSELSKRFDKAISRFEEITDEELDAAHSFEGWPPFYPSDRPTTNIRSIAMGVRDHITHHRAQLTVYLKLNGIKPASYKLY